MAKFKVGICPKCGHRFPLTSSAVGYEPFAKGADAISEAHKKALAGIDTACRDLALSNRVKTKARELFKVAGLNGRTSRVAAGACIYVAAKLVGEPRGQRDVSFSVGCTEVSIQYSYPALMKKAN